MSSEKWHLELKTCWCCRSCAVKVGEHRHTTLISVQKQVWFLWKSRERGSAGKVQGVISAVSVGSGEPNWPRARSLAGDGCTVYCEWFIDDAGCLHDVHGARAHHLRLPRPCSDLGTAREREQAHKFSARNTLTNLCLFQHLLYSPWWLKEGELWCWLCRSSHAWSIGSTP